MLAYLDLDNLRLKTEKHAEKNGGRGYTRRTQHIEKGPSAVLAPVPVNFAKRLAEGGNPNIRRGYIAAAKNNNGIYIAHENMVAATKKKRCA